uniref:Uncharacterized protein n=2 Tax=Parascaris TaxID=6254 RepID=A0A915BEY9_PARUN
MDDNESWPIYAEEYFCSVKAVPIADLSGAAHVPEDKICKSIPQIRITGAEMKVSYLLDHAYVPAIDVCTDNLGIWNSKHRSMTTTTHFIKGPEIGGDNECEYVVRKRTYNHVNARPAGGIRKVVWTLHRSDGAPFRSLLSYHIVEGAEVIKTTHGNAKSSANVYRRTYPSALRRMKELRKTLKPGEILSVMAAEQGAAPGISNTQCLPRNKTQIYVLRKNSTRKLSSEEAARSGTLMEQLFKLSGNVGQVTQLSHTAEENCSKSSYEGSPCDLPLLLSDKQVPTPADCEEAKASESRSPQMSSSDGMTPCEFQAQLVDRLSSVPVEQRKEARERIEHELDLLFAQKVTSQVEHLFDQSSRKNVMERLLTVANS